MFTKAYATVRCLRCGKLCCMQYVWQEIGMNKDKDFVEVHFMKYDSGKILDFGCEMWEGRGHPPSPRLRRGKEDKRQVG